MNTSPQNETAAAPRKNLSVNVFGIGNAGASVMELMFLQGLWLHLLLLLKKVARQWLLRQLMPFIKMLLTSIWIAMRMHILLVLKQGRNIQTI